MLPAVPPLNALAEYRTAPLRPGMLARLFPSLIFYPLMWGVIWRGARVAEAGLYTDEHWVFNSFEVVRALEYVGCRIIVEGLRHLSSFDGPCVIVGNHMSALETTVLPGLVRPHKPVTFVVKRGLTTAPVFRHIMCSRDPVVVDRRNARDDLAVMLKGSKERLEKGISLVVFPQATRNSEFDRASFNSIGIKIAKRNGVPVVPLALKTDAWGQGGLHKDYGRINPALPVHFRFGEPFHVRGAGREEQERLCAFIENARREWDAELAGAPGRA